MERLRGGLRKTGAKLDTAKTSKPSTLPAKGKFKLRASKAPLPLLTTKASIRDSKSKPKLVSIAGSTEKQNGVKPSLVATNSFIRPTTTAVPPKICKGFSFMKLQPKPGEGKKKTTARPSEKPAFSVAKPFLGKFSVCGLAKRSLVPASEAWARTSKTPSTTPRTESGLPLAFRADTKSSAAKKRKTLESRTHEHKSNAFPSKNRRTENNGSFEQKSSFRIDARTEKLAVKDSDTFRAGLSLSGNKAMKQSRDLVKKRGLLLTSVDVDPEPKRLKPMAQISSKKQLENTSGLPETATDSGCSFDRKVASAVSLAESTLLEPTLPSVDSAKAVIPLSPDCREECGIEDKLALKLLCTMDDDKEDEFLTRAAAIQDFTDCVKVEQQKIRSRLVEAHAQVSESLLDALTDLMAEEGGIGIDKLNFDMNIDIDVGDAFLQDDEIQVLQ